MLGNNDERDIETLRNLPLESMLTSVLNAAIKAQAEAALTTAEFVKQIGFVADSEESPLLDDTESPQKLKVRQAELSIESGDDTTTVKLPFISLFNIPSLEIDSLDWSFKAELKSIESFRTDVKYKYARSVSGGSNAEIITGKVPIQLGARMKVEVKEQVDFAVRAASARQQKYSLAVQVKAGNGPTPRGIERLFDIADRIITASITANTDGGA
jgi:hypothetical protein